jgi:hypothetical protein
MNYFKKVWEYLKVWDETRYYNESIALLRKSEELADIGLKVSAKYDPPITMAGRVEMVNQLLELFDSNECNSFLLGIPNDLQCSKKSDILTIHSDDSFESTDKWLGIREE